MSRAPESWQVCGGWEAGDMWEMWADALDWIILDWSGERNMCAKKR